MRWQGSQAGPDWMDIRGMLQAIQETNRTTTWFDISPSGTAIDTTWRVSVISVWPRVKDGARTMRLVSQVVWPNAESEKIEGAIYKLLYDHDAAIAKHNSLNDPPAGA